MDLQKEMEMKIGESMAVGLPKVGTEVIKEKIKVVIKETPIEKIARMKEEIKANKKAALDKIETDKLNEGLVEVTVGENFVSESLDQKYKLNWKDGLEFEIPGPYGYSRVIIANAVDSEVMNFTIRSKEDVGLLQDAVRSFGFLLVEPV